MTYGNAAPWPATPNGFGFSLMATEVNPSGDPNLPGYWRASTRSGGSPGTDDPASGLPAIRINEVLTHPDPPQVDSVEFFNPAATNVDLGGWFLTDDHNTPTKYRLAAKTVVPPGGYRVCDASEFSQGSNGFHLSQYREEVYLFSGDNATNLTGYSHGFAFGAAPTGVSFGRYVNSVGEEQFPLQLAATLGAANAGPRIGPAVFDEIIYHPEAGGIEFVELRNITAANVAFYDPANPTNT
ncbi:MAG: lamin tail domain-containing protein, partial [Verrucomicrobia bacterium]|nr:lamin tail domain-containing protein [Verrucomicrobiota bacterium]